MKKYVFPFAILMAALAWMKFNPIAPSDTKEATEATQISGAYEALNFMGARQTYPYTTLPENAHYAAWERWQTETASARGGDPPQPWESLGPHNRGGRTLAIELNPQNSNTLYAGSASGGLWKSTTGGAGVTAWKNIEIGFPVLGVSTIAIDPTDTLTMYIGTGEVYNYDAAGTGAAYRSTRGSYGMGILKTTDGGTSWSKSLDWSYAQQHGIWMIKFHPTNTDILYAATTEGVYKTTDAGVTWNQMLDVVMATDLLIHPEAPNKIVAACGNFASPGYGIYTSEDGGATWEQIISNLPTEYNGKVQLGAAPSDPDVIYASIGNGFSSSTGATWLCRSGDFGSNWTVQTTVDYSRWQGWFSHDVAVGPDDSDNIIAIGINVWESGNAGINLNLKTQGGVGFANPPIEGPDGEPTYVHSDAHDVKFHPTDPNRIYVASDGGIHRSDDGGDSWYSANGGYQTAQFYNGTSTSQNNTGFYIGGLQDNGTIRWNGDLTWTRVFGGDGSWTAIHPELDNLFFVSYQFLNVQKTFDNGEFFNFVDFGDSHLGPTAFIAPYVIAPGNGEVMYSGSGRVAKSTTGGEEWFAINNEMLLNDNGNPVLSMEVAPQDENVLYAATAPYNGQRGRVYVTVNGNTFSEVTGSLPDRYPMDITVDPTDPATAYIVYSGFGTGHVFKTEDYGGSWEDISDNLPDVPTNAVIVDPLFPDHVYIGNDLGVFVSTAGGGTWTDYQDGLATATMIFDLEISSPNRKLRAATHGNGAYQRDLLNEPVAIDEPTFSAETVKVYPNPAETFATVRFEQNSRAQVRIDLLDVSGQVLATPVNEKMNAGPQQIELDLAILPAGIYFVRLTSGQAGEVVRLVKD